MSPLFSPGTLVGVARPGPTPNRPLGLSAAGGVLVRARSKLSPQTSGPNLPHGRARCVRRGGETNVPPFRVQSGLKVYIFAVPPSHVSPLLLVFVACSLSFVPRFKRNDARSHVGGVMRYLYGRLGKKIIEVSRPLTGRRVPF